MDPTFRRFGAALLLAAMVAAGVAVAFVGFFALLVIVPVVALGFVLLRLWLRLRFREIERQTYRFDTTASTGAGTVIDGEAARVDDAEADLHRPSLDGDPTHRTRA
jgi:hypothetical protein